MQVGLGTVVRVHDERLVQITDGTSAGTKPLTLTGQANDGGPLSLNYAAGMPVQVGVSIKAAGCGSKPQDANVVVQYKGR
jgi:hypothetical protein